MPSREVREALSVRDLIAWCTVRRGYLVSRQVAADVRGTTA